MFLEHFYSRKPIVEKEIYGVVGKDAKPDEVYGIIREFLKRGGKRFRPLLCLSCAGAVGGNPKDALSAAAAIELFHNFTLIHDDIEDNSQMRRAEPCLHIKYGVPLAINAGDGLFMLVWKAALGKGGKGSAESQKILLSSFTSVLEGQAMELAWHRENRWDITKEDYLKMAGGKTASLISASCHAGALLGGADSSICRRLSTFGYKLGLAFQIQDDLLNLVGDEKKYKKEIGGDIREGKRTLMVLDCLKKLPLADAKKMRKILGGAGASNGEIEWCIEKMHSTGSLKAAAIYASSLADEAKKEISQLKSSEDKNDLLAVARYILDREE